MADNQILGLAHFYNPLTGKTTVSFAYDEANTDDHFILEYYDGQQWVPYDGQSGFVSKAWQPAELPDQPLLNLLAAGVRNERTGEPIRFWVGSDEQYQALESLDPGTLYFTNSTIYYN
jgi:hypothetical protein